MSKSDRKQARRIAAAEEQARCWHETEASSPLSREQLEALIENLSERIVANGHDGTNTHTREWLATCHVPEAPVLAFLSAHQMHCDFDILYQGDPHRLFGPTSERLARMPIDRLALERLLDWVDVQVGEHGCDHTVRFTREWLRDEGFPVPSTLTALLAQGGGCDCEILFNVEPENIYPTDATGVS